MSGKKEVYVAKITRTGRVTIPKALRLYLGVRAGDTLLFETRNNEIRLRPGRTESVFEKYRGIGTPGIPPGRKAVVRWLRSVRGW